MKNRKIIAIALILALACSILAACGGSRSKSGDSGSDTIVGTWGSEDFDGAFVFTFNEDGTGNYDAAGTDMPFTYTAEGGKLSIIYEGDTESFDTTYTLSGDKFTMKDSFDEEVVYNRQ